MSIGQRSVRDAASSGSLRVPAPPEGGAANAPHDAHGRPKLRLSLSRGGLAVELDAPAGLGGLLVTELSALLSGVKFPVDLSGGVSRFRHRRGELTRLSLEASAEGLRAMLAPRLRGLLGPQTPSLSIAPIEGGAMIGICAPNRAVAFDVLVAPMDEDVRLLPVRARGIGLDEPAYVVALRALGAIVRPVRRAHPGGRDAVELVGGAVVLRQVARRVVCALMPEAGARAPSTRGVRWGTLRCTSASFDMTAQADAPPPELSPNMLRALELAELSAAADTFAANGKLDDARSELMSALERAPRHPELSMRVAAIDLSVGGRVEAALSTLVDAMGAVDAGVVGGELLASISDDDGACVAFSRSAATEPYGALAALSFLRAAELAADLDQRIWLVDEAVVRAPALAEPRWARLALRLQLADRRGAAADAEHLEAAAIGAAAKHHVCRRLGEVFLAAGHPAEASKAFERGLRYAPDSVEGIAGLARALLELDHPRRAVDLFARAVMLTERKGERNFRLELELAKGLAHTAFDLPAAVARARQVPAGVDASYEARLLEARWRAALDDLAGTAVALSRLHDAVDLLGSSAPPELVDELVPLLAEAARIHEEQRLDLAAARQFHGLLVRLRPRDRRAAAELRRLADAVGPEPGAHVEAAEDPEAQIGTEVPAAIPSLEVEPDVPEVPFDVAPLDVDLGDEVSAPLESSGIADEILADQLTEKLRADPTDRATATRLSDVLGRLERDLELLALLTAQLEGADDELRSIFEPRRRAVLERLAERARADGRQVEAELYEQLLGSDPPESY